MIKKIFKKVQMYGSGIILSFKFDIGKRCQFEKVKFLAAKKSIIMGDRVVILRKTELCANKDKPIIIGSNTFINQSCIIRPNTQIGSNVAIGPRCTIIFDSHEISTSEKRAGEVSYPLIKIDDGCWIGAEVTILGGVIIGKSSVVAAGTVVNKDIPSNVLVAGVPAKVIRELD